LRHPRVLHGLLDLLNSHSFVLELLLHIYHHSLQVLQFLSLFLLLSDDFRRILPILVTLLFYIFFNDFWQVLIWRVIVDATILLVFLILGGGGLRRLEGIRD
jgi:hypothetical protein